MKVTPTQAALDSAEAECGTVVLGALQMWAEHALTTTPAFARSRCGAGKLPAAQQKPEINACSISC
jgi:hypothetical protein